MRNLEKTIYVDNEKILQGLMAATGSTFLNSEDIKSNYAKYMTLDTSSRLKEKGYELLLYDISKK